MPNVRARSPAAPSISPMGSSIFPRRNKPGLVLVAIDTQKLSAEIRWEESRGGDLFPHLYTPLPTAAAIEVIPLPLENGVHVFPDSLR